MSDTEYVIHDLARIESGKGAPHKENIISPEIGEVLSFPNRHAILQYCKELGLNYDDIQITHTRTNDPYYINLRRIEIVNDDLLSKDDLIFYASDYLWNSFADHYKREYNTVQKRPDKKRFVKFMFYTFGKHDLMDIVKRRVEHYDLDPVRSIYNDVKPGIEKICGFRLHFIMLKLIITNPRTSKINTINKKLAIYGYIRKYHVNHFKPMPDTSHIDCIQLLRAYAQKHKIK
jgi:hypothetical protein